MTRFRLREEKLKWLHSDNETIAFDEVGSAYFAANPSGTVLWKRLAEGASRDTLVDALVEAFSIGRGHAAADVDTFLQQLDQAGVLLRESE
jgi:hypothetical protein